MKSLRFCICVVSRGTIKYNEAMENKEKQNRKDPRRIILICLLAGVAALIFFVIRFYTRVAIDPMRVFATPSPQLTIRPSQTPAIMDSHALITPPSTLSPQEMLDGEAAKDFMQGAVNILLLGWDQSPERDDEDSSLYRDEENNFRSDVMMLLRVDFGKSCIDLISIPRDTMASVYETSGRWKINAAFAKGGSAAGDGFSYAMKTVENLLQVPISHYAGVNMEGVKAVVDAMGGVDYDVDVRIELNGRVLEEGYQHLNGQQVLDYCRARKRITGTGSAGANSDIGRADRQQRIIFAIFSQLQQRGQLVNVPKIYDSVKDYVYTDLNAEQIAALALFGQKLDVAAQLHRYTLPGELVSKTSFSNATFYVLDTIALQDMIEEIYGLRIKTDNRFGLPYVIAEKEAKRGREYAAATRYICSLFGLDLSLYEQNAELLSYYADPYYTELCKSVVELEALCEREPWAEVEGYDDALPERAEAEGLVIKEKTDALALALSGLCQSRGLMKTQVEEKLLPEELYDMLP